MKHRIPMIAALLLALSLVPRPGASAGETHGAPALRIGVFDSRAVALAYGRSQEALAHLRKIRQDYEAAKAAKDEKRAKELENDGQWSQVRLHQMVFSTAGVGWALAPVSDRLPAIARAAGVAVLVSKWELPFVGSGVDTVDVTIPMVTLFHPDAQTLQLVSQMKTTTPIPFDRLSLDPNP